MKLSAFVLAGGRSTRMGRDKALLPWGGADRLYPDVHDGVDGMRFVTQCLASARAGGAWQPLVPGPAEPA